MWKENKPRGNRSTVGVAGLSHVQLVWLTAGRALSELTLDRRFETIDLGRFHSNRVAEGRAEPETGVLA